MVFEKINISVNFEPSSLELPTTKEQALKLLEKKHFHLIHYAGHAVFDYQAPDQSHLILSNEEGLEDKINAIELHNLLKSSATCFLYLSCCSGAEISFSSKTDDYYLGLLHASVRAGVPNVLGYRWPVVGRSAKDFATHFYDGMLRFPNSLEKAVWHARQRIFYSANDNKWDETWFSPIL